MKVLIKDFEIMIHCVRSYRMYTCMIDNYRQEKEAEERNQELKNQFLETMRKYRADYPDFRFSIVLEKYNDADSEDLNSNINSIKDCNKAWNEFVGQIIKDELSGRYNEERKESKVWTIEETKRLLAVNDTMLYRSLLKLYECQTADEKADGQTHEYNGVGFNGVDAPILTSFVEFYKKRGFLSTKQKAIARKKIMKYAKQITNLANPD